MENTLESFDNYFNIINSDLYNGYSEKLVSYFNKKFGDKWNFHLIFNKEKYYPLTYLGTKENILKISENNNKNRWYIKKRDGSYGRNITITDNPKNFFNKNIKSNDFIIQKEIKPDIVNKRKYDYRIYFLILKKNNKEVKLHEDYSYSINNSK